MYNKHIFTGIE